jgi:hypothetical protein
VKLLLLAVRAPPQPVGSFHCFILQTAAREWIPTLGDCVSQTHRLQRARRRISLDFVRKGIIALLALILALHAGFSCGVGQAAAAIQAPCCGDSCPTPSVAGDAACCQTQDSGATAQVVSGRPHVPGVPILAGILRPCLASPGLCGIVQTSAFHTDPPGALKLALLCSRQI